MLRMVDRAIIMAPSTRIRVLENWVVIQKTPRLRLVHKYKESACGCNANTGAEIPHIPQTPYAGITRIRFKVTWGCNSPQSQPEMLPAPLFLCPWIIIGPSPGFVKSRPELTAPACTGRPSGSRRSWACGRRRPPGRASPDGGRSRCPPRGERSSTGPSPPGGGP